MTIYLDDYKTFNSKQELNYHVKQHEQAHSDVLNATDRSILRFIARYSVKYAGASHLKVSTIAEGPDKSDRTVHRILKRLEGLSIIKRIDRTRPKTGGQGASIMQILPFVSEPMTDGEIDEKARHNCSNRHNSENEPLGKRDKPNYILETATASVLETTQAVKNAIPNVIYDTLNPFFNGKDLRRITGVIFRAKAHKVANVRIENHADDFTTVLLDCIRRYKEGTVRSLDGYIFKSIKGLTRRLFLGIA